MPNARHAASQAAITMSPTASGGAMSPSVFRAACMVMPFAMSCADRVSAR